MLQFITADGSKISARPSGTEPKIKFYFSVHTTLASKEAYDDTFAGLDQKFNELLKTCLWHRVYHAAKIRRQTRT